MLKATPSNAPRFVPCPGSMGMEAPFPRSPGHPVQQEGIALHWAAEHVLMSWLPVNSLTAKTMGDYRGQACPENGVIIDDEMVWAGGVYLENVWARAHGSLENLMAERPSVPHTYIEKMRGRVDATWQSADFKWLTIWDLKYGFKPKTAFENWQLIAYVLGLITEHTETIELVVVQPRGVSAAQPVKVWEFSVAEFWPYAQTLIDAVAEGRGPNPRTVAGPHCDYCKAAANCATLQAAGMGAIETGSAAISPDLTNVQIGHEIALLDRARDVVKARLDAMEGLAIARQQTGGIVPGVAYRKSLSNRQWTLPDAQMLAMGGMFDVDIVEHRPLSPNQAEGRGLSREVIDKFTTRKELAPKLVRTDRRAAREAFQK